MNNIPMKFDYSKTLNEQLPTFEYYKNRYCSYGLQISQLQQENQHLKEENQILKLENENIIKYADRDYKINLKIEQKENQHLKDRVNKAIEYIEKCNPDVDLHNMFLNENYISNYGACELLEILKGVKDDNRK